MAYNLSDTLVVGISSTALFDLGAESELFRQWQQEDHDQAIIKYRELMRQREDEALKPGTAFAVIEALLKLNEYQRKPPLVEVVVLSRNSPETAMRALKTIRSLGLQITRSAFTGGESVTDYIDAFDVDLLLTTDVTDAQRVIDSKRCAAAVVLPSPDKGAEHPSGQVRIAFDGDAVLFSDESEALNRTQGLIVFHKNEDDAQDVPLAEGPHATFLRKLAALQTKLPMQVEVSPVRIAVITARNSPAELRVINTLRDLGVYVDAVFFLGGIAKTKILEAFKPHIFFDDQDENLTGAAHLVPSAKVPLVSGSPLSVHESDTNSKDEASP